MNKRLRLPNRRPSEIIAFDHEGVGYIGEVSRFDDGRLAEVFLDAGKVGTSVDIMAKDGAVILSIALQHGVPLQEIMAALSQERDGKMLGPFGVLLQRMVEGAA